MRFLLYLSLLALSGLAYADPVLPSGYVLIALSSPKLLQQTDGTSALKTPNEGSWKVLMNGTFFDDHFHSVGTLFQDGVRVATGLTKARTRGAVAQLADGEIRLCVQPNSTGLDALQSACAPGDAPIRNFIGGAAMLIRAGRAVSSSELFTVQRFDNGGPGLQAEQFRRTTHSAIGIAGGKAYAIAALNETGEEIQRDALNAGFTDLVMLDGGSGFYFKTPEQTYGSHPSPTGLLE